MAPNFLSGSIGSTKPYAPFLKRKAHTRTCPGRLAGNSGCLHRRSRGTTWVEQDGAKPLPMLSFPRSKAKQREEPITRRAERRGYKGSAVPLHRHPTPRKSPEWQRVASATPV